MIIVNEISIDYCEMMSWNKTLKFETKEEMVETFKQDHKEVMKESGVDCTIDNDKITLRIDDIDENGGGINDETIWFYIEV